MKKNFVLALLTMVFVPTISSAQNYYDRGFYNQGYANQGYANQGYSNQGYAHRPSYRQLQSMDNSTYHAPHKIPKEKPRDIGQISVGADYVLGYASYETVDFVVPSALTGGEDFVSDTRDFDRSYNSLSFNLGWRPLRNIGIEAFYSTSLNETKVLYTESYSHYPEFARGEYELSYKAMGLDLLGYFPLNNYFEFIASVGIGKYESEAKINVIAYEDSSHNSLRSTSKTFEDSKLAYRLGLGGQLWLSKHLTMRAMVRWTQINGEFINYITEVNAGVRYHF